MPVHAKSTPDDRFCPVRLPGLDWNGRVGGLVLLRSLLLGQRRGMRLARLWAIRLVNDVFFTLVNTEVEDVVQVCGGFVVVFLEVWGRPWSL